MKKVLTVDQASKELAYYAQRGFSFERAKNYLVRDYIIVPVIMKAVNDSSNLYNNILAIQELKRERKTII